MTPTEFNLLSLDDREKLVCREGVFIAIRQEPEFIIRLYEFDFFYVELFYHQVKKGAITIRSFTHTSGLDPYLSGIDLGFG
jgi:hypothetical protein